MLFSGLHVRIDDTSEYQEEMMVSIHLETHMGQLAVPGTHGIAITD